ncbi:MAG: putative membrane protein YdjX (TVP38/TMEM64 family) [Psychromonas sp.]|jgi:uncharacterized membrane protein YdjX (TVP38/TMEM64 family)
MKKNNWPLYLLLAALGLATLCLSFTDICPLIELIDPSINIDKTTISNFIRDLGPWGPASSIALMIAHSFVPFPAELLTFANGMVYGQIWGVIITWVGAMLGAVASFSLTKRYGRPFVEKKVSPSQLEKIDHWVHQQGVWSLLLARFIPIISFNLINYAAGMTSVSWWTFLWTTGVGILPITIIMVAMGNNFDIIPWWVWIIVLAVVMGAAYFINSLIKNKLKTK